MAFHAFTRISGEQWSPLVSRQPYASRGVHSLTLGTCEELLQGTAARMKTCNSLPCPPCTFTRSTDEMLTSANSAYPFPLRWAETVGSAGSPRQPREGGRRGSPTPATESFVVGLQGTPTHSRQQLQATKAHNPYLSLPLSKGNVGLSLALAWGTLITHNLASIKEDLLLPTCTQ